MDKAISFENGIRIGQAWLKDSGKKDRPQDEAAVAAEPAPAARVALTGNDAVGDGSDSASSGAVRRSPASASSALPITDIGTAAYPEVAAAGAEASPRSAASAPAPSAERPPELPPMRGVTVGTPGAPQSHSSSAAVAGAVRGQTLAAVFALVALAPPIATGLILGLSHRAHEIPYASVWAWMAALIALAATARSALTAVHRAATAWVLPALLGVFLLLPAMTVLCLRFTTGEVTTRLAVVQIALYTLALAGLLLSSLAAVPE